MAKQYAHKTSSSSLLKPVAIGLSLAVPTLMLVLTCLLPRNDLVHAGANIWTWSGIGGSAETVLSDPINPSVVYAIVDNRRLFKTNDNGKTWSEMPAPPHGGTLLNVRLAPNDSNVLYLWGYDSGKFLYRSIDGGNTWQALSKAGEIAVSPVDWKEVYLSSGGSLFKSINGGDTWIEISQFPSSCPPPYNIYIAPSAPQVMITVFNPPTSMDFYLCKTIDGGHTWSPLSISSPVIHTVVFDPKNSNTIYLASIGGGWKSTDGGSSWQPMANGLDHPAQFVIDPDNTQVIHAADYTNGVLESVNGGTAWTPINTGIQGLSVRTIAIGSRNPLKIYAGVMYSGVWEVTRTNLQDYGITVNNGALFTNQTAVTLTLTAPPGTTQMMTSNDGGFGGGVWEAFANTRPWTITAYGNTVIPRTVYAKFMTNGQISGQYQDDIILDQTSPTGTLQITDTLSSSTPGLLSAVRVATDTYTHTVCLPIVGKNYRPGMRLVALILSATDDASGVDSVLVSNEGDFAGAQWQVYTTGLNWWVSDKGTTTVYVKYRDRAGNESQVYSATTTAP